VEFLVAAGADFLRFQLLEGLGEAVVLGFA